MNQSLLKGCEFFLWFDKFNVHFNLYIKYKLKHVLG